MRMHVLVIGGAGYIGSHIVRELLDHDYQVTVFDNLSTGTRENLFPEASFVEGDITDIPLLKSAFTSRIDGVFHLAASKAAGESMVNPGKYSTNNITGTINILNTCVEHAINRIIFSSSAAVYGEPEYIPIDEKHPVHPQNYYGFTKLEVERIMGWYDKIYGMRYASLRYFNAAGYDQKQRIKGLEINPQNLLPIIMEVAAGKREKLLIFGNDYDTADGTCIRDYIHVSDLAKAHIKAMEYLFSEDESLTVNLGSERGISVKEIVAAARLITGKKIPAEIVGRRAGDAAVLCASSTRAKQLLNWTAEASEVEQLLRSTWEMYKNLQ